MAFVTFVEVEKFETIISIHPSKYLSQPRYTVLYIFRKPHYFCFPPTFGFSNKYSIYSTEGGFPAEQRTDSWLFVSRAMEM